MTTCPGCSGKLIPVPKGASGVAGLFLCASCEGYVGEGMALLDSYRVVSPNFAKDPNVPAIYYDFSGLDGDGKPYRRHGWFDPETGDITQVG